MLASLSEGEATVSLCNLPYPVLLTRIVHSLPPDVDEGEVAQPLREHLATYASIKDVKIIRDSKGGLCAFVQCEVSLSALLIRSFW